MFSPFFIHFARNFAPTFLPFGTVWFLTPLLRIFGHWSESRIFVISYLQWDLGTTLKFEQSIPLPTPKKLRTLWNALTKAFGKLPWKSTSTFGGHLEWVEQTWRGRFKTFFNMGAGQSAEIPGGGSEGYHVLRVSYDRSNLPVWFELEA